MRLEDRRALVTGGSRSIGRAIALALGREGADVVVNFKTHRDAAEEVVGSLKELGRRATAVQGSTDSGEDIQRFVSEADEFLDGIDLLVNNAGVLKRTPFLEISEEEWDWMLDTNLKGYFLVSQAVARHMVDRKREGAFINVSSAGQAVAAPDLTH